MRSLIKNTFTRAGLSAVLAGALIFVAGAEANTITIYKNGLNTADGRSQMHQMRTKTNCERGGSRKAFRFKLGRRAKECFYRVPVVGRDLQFSAVAWLFKTTPKRVLKRSYVSISLRQDTDGSRYQFLVWPAHWRYSLRKVMPNGRVVNFGSKKAGRKVNGPGKANRLTLRAFNGPKGGVRLMGIVNGNRVVVAGEQPGNALSGRDTSISIGAKKSGRGAIGSFRNLRVAMPDPF